MESVPPVHTRVEKGGMASPPTHPPVEIGQDEDGVVQLLSDVGKCIRVRDDDDVVPPLRPLPPMRGLQKIHHLRLHNPRVHTLVTMNTRYIEYSS